MSVWPVNPGRTSSLPYHLAPCPSGKKMASRCASPALSFVCWVSAMATTLRIQWSAGKSTQWSTTSKAWLVNILDTSSTQLIQRRKPSGSPSFGTYCYPLSKLALSTASLLLAAPKDLLLLISECSPWISHGIANAQNVARCPLKPRQSSKLRSLNTPTTTGGEHACARSKGLTFSPDLPSPSDDYPFPYACLLAFQAYKISGFTKDSLYHSVSTSIFSRYLSPDSYFICIKPVNMFDYIFMQIEISKLIDSLVAIFNHNLQIYKSFLCISMILNHLKLLKWGKHQKLRIWKHMQDWGIFAIYEPNNYLLLIKLLQSNRY